MDEFYMETKNQKIKVYAISIMAFVMRNDAKEMVLEFAGITDSELGDNYCYVQHLPGLISAENIQQAAEAAKNQALQFWRPEAGYYGHQALIMPVTREFFSLAQIADITGSIDKETVESPLYVRF